MVRLRAFDTVEENILKANFNSSMVRLRDNPYGVQSSLHLFQFQYGTIERLKVASVFLVILKFQFQYGTIESSSSLLRSIAKKSFQFQYGTIERKIKKSFNNFSDKFQFQYGTIESKLCFVSCTCSLISIPVWYD